MAHDPMDGLEVGQVPLCHVHQFRGVYLVGEVGRAVLQRGRVFILVAVFLGIGTEASLGLAPCLGLQAAGGPLPPLPPASAVHKALGPDRFLPSLSFSPLVPLSPPSPQPLTLQDPWHLCLPKSQLHRLLLLTS